MSDPDAPVQGRSLRVPRRQSSVDRIRRSAVIRVMAAVLLAAAATAVLIALASKPDPPITDVVGYSIFYDSNIENYFHAYYAIVGFFPVAALLIFFGLTRIGPTIGLDAPPSRGSLRPRAGSSDGADPVGPAASGLATAPIAGWLVAAGRIAFVGAVLGLEVGIVTQHSWRGLLLGAAAFGAAAPIVAAAAGRWTAPDRSLEMRLAAVNAIAAPLTLGGLVLVSAHTEVTVLANGSVHHYPWFPAWLGLPIAVALVAVIAVRQRRATSVARARAIERWALLLVAAPVAIFLSIAILPGDLGPVEMFESGQGLVGAQLVGRGWLPWRDAILAHGLLQDAGIPAFGEAVFGSTQWGRTAGYALLTGPIFIVLTFLFFVYLFRRNIPFLIFSGLVLVGTTYAPPDVRFMPWPLVLLLLVAVINNPSRLRSAALAFMVLLLAIVTPEATPAVPAVAVVLVLYEWYWREPGTSLALAFRRTVWFAGVALLLSAMFAIYMASRGALDDFVYITASLVPGHALSGGVPPNPFEDMSNLRFGFEALAPVAALLISFAYGVSRLRLRRRFQTDDWIVGAVAVFLLFYYLKFLSYMDVGHLAQVFEIALPLMLFIAYRALGSVDRWVRRRAEHYRIGRMIAHPVSLVLVAFFVGIVWGRMDDQVSRAAIAFRPTVPTPATPKIGYSSAPYDPVVFADLRRVIDAYTTPNDRIFDFTNAPTLYYDLLDRDPSTRYLVVLIAHTQNLQDDVISELRRAPPKLIVFDSSVAGLANWDGIPNMVRHYAISSWILAHYRPLIATHTTTIYGRRDQPSPSKLGLRLSQKPITRGVDFQGQPCLWGDAPNFLERARNPDSAANPVRARLVGSPRPQLTISGWAGDPGAKAPAREIIATVNGRVVARAAPRLSRPDLPAGGLPSGYDQSGFQMTVPLPSRRAQRDLELVAIARDGSATRLLRRRTSTSADEVPLGRRSVTLDPSAIQGSIDSETGATTIQFAVPSGTHWRDYRWLQLDAGPQGFRAGGFALYDRRNRPSMSREISFQTIDGSPNSYNVPVSSCPQWHGYSSPRLFLSYKPQQRIAGVKLIR